MAELLYSRYIPKEISLKRVSDDFYLLEKPQQLEMVFREGEEDYVFQMMDQACNYYGKKRISDAEVMEYVMKITSKELLVSVFHNEIYIGC